MHNKLVETPHIELQKKWDDFFWKSVINSHSILNFFFIS